jgi:aldehyde dehydrogenase (NAD+)
MVWINCANQMDASAGFGELSRVRDWKRRRKEGLYEYVKLKMKDEFSSKPVLPKAVKQNRRKIKIYSGRY